MANWGRVVDHEALNRPGITMVTDEPWVPGRIVRAPVNYADDYEVLDVLMK